MGIQFSINECFDTDKGNNLELESTDVLTIERVDLCLEENHIEHHTAFFNASKEEKALIVRRGTPFRVHIFFNRAFNPTKDAISLIFAVADDSKLSLGRDTLTAIIPHDGVDRLGTPLEWRGGIEAQTGNMLTILLKTAVVCPVTEWTLDIDTKLFSGGSKTYTVQTPIYILFNPWCPDDQVYISDKAERKEYVQNDTTLIWRGSYNRMQECAWKLGQFESNVLECSLKLLGTVAHIPAAYRGDPVRVARSISAAVNSPDDDGMLFGNWTNDFSGGLNPTKWTSSSEIIQQFWKTKKTVKYAQCFVFAGVVTAIGRALGIPTRAVTCYSSAHDTRGSLTVDIFVDDKYKILKEESADSIWNFHVWNEVWMTRPDLGIGPNGLYDGWQAIDATPQEKSENIYRVGPAPVVAVKHGEILKPYDVGFLFSEVNADRVYWRYKGPNHPLKLLRTDPVSVGLLISTKSVTKWEREDITANYKFPEKTNEERNIMLKALMQSGQAFSRYYLNDNFNEVEFEMKVNDDIDIGEDFTIIVRIKNKSKKVSYNTSVYIYCETLLYTGVGSQEIKSKGFVNSLEPDSTEFLRLSISFQDYFKKLKSQSAFKISCAGKVMNTDYEYYVQEDFRVRKPTIQISCQGEVIVHKTVDVIVRMNNPLPVNLHKGVFTVEGPGIDKPLHFKIAQTPVAGTAACTFKYVPPYEGKATLVVKFYSKELDDVSGFLNYDVRSAVF